MKPHDAVQVVGFGLILSGLWWLFAPLALLVAGVVVLWAGLRMESARPAVPQQQDTEE